MAREHPPQGPQDPRGVGDYQNPEWLRQFDAECPPRESEVVSRPPPHIQVPKEHQWLCAYLEYMKNQFLDKFFGILTKVNVNAKLAADILPPFFKFAIDDTQCLSMAPAAVANILSVTIPPRHRGVIMGIGWAHDAVAGFSDVVMDVLVNGQVAFPYNNMQTQRGTPTQLRQTHIVVDGPVEIAFQATNNSGATTYITTASWSGWHFPLERAGEFTGPRFQQ